MTKQVLDFKQGLSIQELEERHELTVAAVVDGVEGDKENSPTTRCSGNSNGGG